jgi:hypothetical protein
LKLDMEKYVEKNKNLPNVIIFRTIILIGPNKV